MTMGIKEINEMKSAMNHHLMAMDEAEHKGNAKEEYEKHELKLNSLVNKCYKNDLVYDYEKQPDGSYKVEINYSGELKRLKSKAN